MATPEQLEALADRIDHEKLWRLAAMYHDRLTQDQRDRLDAGVQLRRYARNKRELEHNREPLSKAQIFALHSSTMNKPECVAIEFARMIERAHGIEP